MMKGWKVRAAVLCGFALTLVVMSQPGNRAEARPAYLKAFMGKYKNLEKQVKETKCNVCHYGKSKKNRNDYGQELAKAIDKKNEKDAKKIAEALKKVEKKKSSKSSEEEEMTFGDLIKDDKLPGTPPEEDEEE